MNKERNVPQALLLSIILLTSILIFPVKAYQYRDLGSGGSASELYSSDWIQRQIDLNYINWAYSEIFDIFADRVHYYGYTYYHIYNCKSETYEWRVESHINDCQDNHDFATFLYYGHYGQQEISGTDELSYGFHEQAAPDAPEPSIIWDGEDIYPNIDPYGTIRFVFLWACRNGDIIGSSSPEPHGMPYCWSHTYLPSNGYHSSSGSISFIGFTGASPCISEGMGTYYQGEEYIYKYWLVFLYYFLVHPDWHLSLSDALDYASMACGIDGWLAYNNRLSQGWEYYWPGGGGMDEDTYWGQMKVYGYGYTYLPTGVY